MNYFKHSLKQLRNSSKFLLFTFAFFACLNVDAQYLTSITKIDQPSFDKMEFSGFIDLDIPESRKLQLELSKSKNKDVFHLISHGKSGELFVEGKWLNAEMLTLWIQENNFLKDKFHLNIYGCEFAKGKKGKLAVSYLEKTLRVSIAASDDVTGKNGDWDLEIGSASTAISLSNYAYNLQTCAGIVGGTGPDDDRDGDGYCNNVDLDDDNDGILDTDEGHSNVLGAGIHIQCLNGDIKKFNHLTNVWDVVCSAIPYNGDIALSPTGEIYVCDYTAGSVTVYRVNGDCTTTQVATTTATEFGAGLSFLPDGRIILGTNLNGILYQVNLSTGLISTYGNIGGGNYINGDFVVQNNILYYSAQNSGSSISLWSQPLDASFNPTGTATLIGPVDVNSIGFSIDANGNLLGLATGDVLENISLTTGSTGASTVPTYGCFGVGASSVFDADGGCLQDTDGDGICDYLDLDSDNDGCPDAVEAGHTDPDNDGIVGTGAPSVDGDGLVIGITYSSPAPAAVTDANQNSACCDVSVSGFPDNDGDNIANACDLDDDNDGILDVDEGVYNTPINSSNGSAFTGCYATNSVALSGTGVTGTGAGNYSFRESGSVSAGATYTFTFTDAVDGVSLFFDNILELGVIGNFSVEHEDGSTQTGLNFNLSANPYNYPGTQPDLLIKTSVGGILGVTDGITNDGTVQAHGTVELLGITERVKAVSFEMLAVNPTGTNFTAYSNPIVHCNTLDSDVDGIPDYLDTDSDNDGCPDAVEAGHTDSDGNGIVGTGTPSIDGDGLVIGITYPSPAPTPVTDVNQNSACCDVSVSGFPDNDGDNLADNCDLDNDNDGILDTVENPCGGQVTNAWTGSGDTFTGSGAANNATVSFTHGPNSEITYSPTGTHNNLPLWSNTSVESNTSFEMLFQWDTSDEGQLANAAADADTAIMTITYAQPVFNPIIHIERLGGSGSDIANYFSNSTEFTLVTPGLSMNKLSGNSQLIVESIKFYRAPFIDLGSTNPGSDSDLTSTSTAAGSIQVNGMVTTVTFSLTGIGVEGTGLDGIEFSFEGCTGIDTDNDGIPDYLDTDSDNDGCPDAVEAAGGFVTADILNDTLTGGVDANGVPNVASPGQATSTNVTDSVVNACAPNAVTDSITVNEDTTGVFINVQNNDSDSQGDSLITTVISSPTSGGTVTVVNSDSLSYIPPADFNGLDTIVYQICDTTGACDIDTVFITVNPVNDAPSQGNEVLTVGEDTPTATISPDLADNNIDPDGTPVTITTVVSSTGGGTVTIAPGDTTLNYTPAPNFTGIDTVIYTVCDNGLPLPAECVDDTLFVTVNPVNDVPSQGNETASTNEDIPVTSGNLTTNNVDPDGTPVTITTIVSSTGGSTPLISGGGTTIDYTPASNFNGIDTIIYMVCDAGLPLPAECVNDTLFITVNPINDAPSQGNETASTNEDTPVTSANLTTNNVDPDGTATTVTTIVSSSAGGTTSITGGGTTIDYDPPAGFNGIDTVIYTVCDAGTPTPIECVNDTLFVTVNPVNDPPSQGNETASTNEDIPVTTGNLTTNNIDPDGTLTTVTTVVSSTGGGTTTISGGGTTIDYVPATNFNGIDTVIYTICDAGLPLPAACVNDTLFVTVDPVNDAPTQGNEAMSVGEDSPATTSVDLTGNNTDPDGTALTVTTIVSNTGGGTVTNNNDGTVDYTPAPNFTGVDTVIYTVCDAGIPLPAACVNDTLFVTVTEINDPPSQGNETMGPITEDETNPTTSPDLTTNNVDPDGTATTVTTVVSSTGGGTTTITNGGTTIDYVPAPNFNGTDTVIYTICDAGLPLPAACVNDTLFVTVDPVNDAPTQGNEAMSVGEDSPATTSVDLTGNNTDPDGTALTVTTIVSNTGGGTVTNNNDGTVDYTPAPNFTGVDTVIYTVCDAGIPLPAACVNDTLFVTVTEVNDPPSQGNETMGPITEDETNPTTSPDLTTNNVDPDGTATTVTTVVSSTGGGTTTITNGGTTIDYVPAPNFNGTDTVIYTICDAGLPLPAACVNDTLFVTVDPVNDAPTQGNEAMSVGEDSPATTSVDLTGNNTDPDGTALTVTTIVSNTGGGTVTNNNDGTVDYTPAPNFTGVDTVIYTVCDAGIPLPAACVNDTLFVTVTEVNDPPSQGNETMGPITEDETNPTTSPDLTTNNVDPDGTATTVTTVVSSTGGGTTTITNGGTTIDYVPAPNFNGTDTVIYTICDAGLPLPAACVNDTLFVTVDPVNDAPTQGNEAMSVGEDSPATTSVDLTGNNTDPDGTALTVTTIVSNTGGGTVTNNNDGTVDYTPAPNFTGVDTVIYTVCDAGIPLPAACVNDTLFVTVTEVNDPPSQGNETMGPITEDETNPTTSPDLTTNNVDPDGTATTVTTVVSSTGGGTTTITNGGTTIDYVPAPNFNGTDTVIYTICDAGLPLPAACVNDTLFVTVDPVNDAPTQGNEAMSVGEDSPATTSVDLTGNNTDPDGTALTVTTIVSNTGGGTVTNNNDGTVDYTPAPNFTGVDTVIYTVCDAGMPLPAACVNDTLFVTVTEINDPPSQGNETMGPITEDETNPTTSPDLTTNNVDPDGTATTVTTVVSSTGGGTTTITNGGTTIDYVPAPNFNGTDTVIYTICDAGLPLPAACVNDTLFVIVTPVNDSMSQGNETLGGILEDQSAPTTSGDLTINNVDPDGTTTTVTTIVSTTGGGTVTINAGGTTVDYTPGLDFNGIDTVIYTICDNGLPLPAICVNDTLFVTVDPQIDSDGDGVSDDVELANGTDPNDPCSLIVANQNMTPQVSFLNGDCDGDGVTNGDEIDPDGDGTPGPNGTNFQDSCDYDINNQVFANVSAAYLAADCDGDGVTNGDEIDPDGDGTPGPNGTNPQDPCDFTLANQNFAIVTAVFLAADCDGDGVTNGDEIDPDGDGTAGPNGTNPLDTCDFNLADVALANADPAFLAADCDGDGVSNGDEIDPDGDGIAGPNGTNPHDPCDFTLANQVLANADPAFLAADCDGDGVTNGDEIDPDGDGVAGPNGTNPLDPCDYNIADQVFANVSAAFLLLDCDGDGVTNGDEIDPDGDGTPGPNGTNPQDPCDVDITNQDFSTVSAAYLAADCDGDGVTNGDEIDPDGDGIAGPNGTNPNDPCDFDIANQDFTAVSAAFLAADCDGDGVTNGDEIDPDGDGVAGPNGTNPQDPCDFDIAFQDFSIVSPAFLAADCDGDGVTNGDEIDPDGDGVAGPNGTNPQDPCDFDIANQDFSTVSPAFLAADCDGDGVTNGDEIDPDGDGIAGPNGTNPLDPCDYNVADQVFANVSPAFLAADCDGDGVTNGDEIDPDGDGVAGPNGTDPSDPCDFDIANQDFSIVSAAFLAADCDGDGVTNGDEIDPDGDGVAGPNGTNPQDPCDFDIAFQDFSTVSPAFLAADCDGDGVTNGDEIDPDGDGIAGPNGTNPQDPCDFNANDQVIANVTQQYLDADCDGDGVTNGDEINDGTDPFDPCSLIIASQTVTPSQAWNDADCDNDGVTNGDEVIGGSNPFDPCDPRPCGLVIPQAFTPDGDNVNDLFVIEGIENYAGNVLIIYNRWGNIVFNTTDYENDWAGTNNVGLVVGGEELPTGTYYYVLDSKDPTIGEDGIFKGYIYIQR